MKKVATLLVFIILANFIFGNFVYATDTPTDTTTNNTTENTSNNNSSENEGSTNNTTVHYNKDSYDALVNEGTVTLETAKGTNTTQVNSTTSTVGSILGMLASMFNPFGMIFSLFISNIAEQGGFFHTDSDYSAAENGFLTISSIVFGEYLLFNTKIYENSSDLNPDAEPSSILKIVDNIKDMAMGVYKLVSRIVMIIFILLLAVAGIMVLKSIIGGTDTPELLTRMKKVLFAWAFGLIFVYCIPGIIVFLNLILDKVMNIIWSIKSTLESSGYSSFEVETMKTFLNSIVNFGGSQAFMSGVVYIAFVIFQIIFFGNYLLSTFKCLLLVVLAPIIVVMNAFNKLNKDKDSENILGKWFSMYLTLLFIQPIHAVLYLVFIFTASEIAIAAPLLGLVFLWALLRAEKIVKVMFNLNTGKISSLFKKQK